MEVNTASQKQAYAIKDHLDGFLKDTVFPLLEDTFRDVDTKLLGKNLQIERLDLDLTTVNTTGGVRALEDIKFEIVSGVKKELDKLVLNAEDDYKDSEEENALLIDAEEKGLKSLLHFLQYGTSPWWSGSKSLSFLTSEKALKSSIKTPLFEQFFLNQLQKLTTQQRLINQFSDNAIKILLKEAFKSHILLDKQLIHLLDQDVVGMIQKLEAHSRKTIWELIIDLLQRQDLGNFQNKLITLCKTVHVSKTKKKNTDTIIQIVALLFQKTESSGAIWNQFSKVSKATAIATSKYKNLGIDSKNREEIEEAIVRYEEESGNVIIQHNGESENVILKYTEESDLVSVLEDKEEVEMELLTENAYFITNAGLIMLHPYLRLFFENHDLLDADNQFKDPELAVHLLHYMATGREQEPEQLLVFEKFLCNIPIPQSIPRNVKIKKKYKTGIEELLQASILNWGVLKGSSVALFRNEFLQRPGKLILDGKHPKIIVERKTQDILIDKLPWNLNLVKLPWKEGLIFTDW